MSLAKIACNKKRKKKKLYTYEKLKRNGNMKMDKRIM